jgi:hypothetical protein
MTDLAAPPQSPAYFRGEVLNRDTPTRVPEDIGVPVGLFGIEPFETE